MYFLFTRILKFTFSESIKIKLVNKIRKWQWFCKAKLVYWLCINKHTPELDLIYRKDTIQMLTALFNALHSYFVCFIFPTFKLECLVSVSGRFGCIFLILAVNSTQCFQSTWTCRPTYNFTAGKPFVWFCILHYNFFQWKLCHNFWHWASYWDN